MIFCQYNFLQNVFFCWFRRPAPLVVVFPFLDLPIELQLLCFSFMSVECLIVSSQICSDWRQLRELADIHPVRRRLFSLYRLMRENPRPDKLTRRYLARFLNHEFDREAYINELVEQNPIDGVPEEFRFWVLEWPAKLYINGIWPGLPFTACLMDTNATGGSSRRYGKNYLAAQPPTLSLVWNPYLTRGDKYSPMFCIWTGRWQGTFNHSNCKHPDWDPASVRVPDTLKANKLAAHLYIWQWECETWLMLDGESDYFGKVLEYPVNFAFTREIATKEAARVPAECCPDWIEYLERRWLGKGICGREIRSGVTIPKWSEDFRMYRPDKTQPRELTETRSRALARRASCKFACLWRRYLPKHLVYQFETEAYISGVAKQNPKYPILEEFRIRLSCASTEFGRDYRLLFGGRLGRRGLTKVC
ncbi:hypothetical protein CVT26_008634 [Gymnopilus dilepis]|uniref:F-box domain-containing protein n=1 Tax=Gymnopilus dilepis TaxID=231916 RepID=A0A409XXZ1_9AGAR|nr:hypothetical protein CVT26_008634 [Gymnopilus dilepis]